MSFFLKQSTATTVILGPFVDPGDGATLETSLTVTSIDVDLYKGSTKSDLTITASGGDNDMAHVANGYYSLELTSGNTDTLGRLLVTAYISTALSVWHSFTVLPANVYDSLIGNTDYLQIDNAQWLGQTIAAVDTNGYPKVTLKSGTGTGEVNLSSGNIAGSIGSLAAQAKADVNAEVDTALADARLDRLMQNAVTGTDVTDNSVIARLVSKSATADWDTYDNTTDSLEAIHDAQLTAAQVNTEVDTAIADARLDRLMQNAVTGTDVTDDSVIARLVSKSATADWDTYDNTTDSLEARQDDKAGYVLAATGLDLIDVPEVTPGAEPDSVLGLLRMIYNRHFRRAELTSSTLRTYKKDGVGGATDILTEQTVSDDGTTQIQQQATYPA